MRYIIETTEQGNDQAVWNTINSLVEKKLITLCEKGDPIEEMKENLRRVALASLRSTYGKIPKEVTCRRYYDKSLNFYTRNPWNYNITIPAEVMPPLPIEVTSKRVQYANVISDEKASIPIIPPKYLPAGKLNDYYVLWEVENWQTKPKDPLLLKKVSDVAYIVLAAWDLTPVERLLLK